MSPKAIATATAIAIWLAIAEMLHHWFGLRPHAAAAVAVPITAALALWAWSGNRSGGSR